MSSPADAPKRRTGASPGVRARARVRWWRRLEARVVVALIVLGVASVSAGAYLVWLTVRYFDQLGDAQVRVAEDAIDRVRPFYEGLVAAKREAFAARTRALARELSLVDDAAELGSRLKAELDANPDVLELAVTGDGRAPVALAREPTLAGIIRVESAAPLPDGPAGPAQLAAVYGVDPDIDRQFQTLGELRRHAGAVEVEGGLVERDEHGRAVVSVLALLSGLILLAAVAAGFVLARSTTRKVSLISEVLRRIAAGELEARAPALGGDEIGLLAADLNRTLDQLDQARRRVAYLQRIGAWQEVARRIAHEIKNPLTPIQLAAQQLRDKAPRDRPEFTRLVNDSVEIIEDEIEGLRRMVTSFSRFAKVPEVRLEPLDVARLLEEFERAWGEREDGQLEVLSPAEPLPTSGDRQLLKQALVNLVENGILSAREAGVAAPRVRVRARGVGSTIEIEVDDNGPGIELDRRERVFEPYATTRESGTGLGLAIVKKIVLDHQGEITAEESPEEGGARFVIRLPRT